MNYRPQILPPSTEQDFEILCWHVYSKVFNCTTPAMYGRNGQKQYGLDALIYENNLNTSSNIIGIQCKHVQKLSFDGKSGDSIVKEVNKADTGRQDLAKLIIATSLFSDQQLIDDVNTLSEERRKEGKFLVEVQFWNDIENHISTSSILSERYHSNLNYLGQISLAKEFFNKERYIDAIESVKDEDSDLMNHSEIFEVYNLLANCYYKIEKIDKFLEYFKKVEKYGWEGEKYNSLNIIKSIVDGNKPKAKRLIESYLQKDPKNLSHKILKHIIEIEDENVIGFMDLPAEVKCSYDIKLTYLEYYYRSAAYEKYDLVKATLNENEKKRPSFLSLSLGTSIIRYNSEKSNYNIIESDLNNLQDELNINKIDIPSLKSTTIHHIITASSLLNKHEIAKQFYHICLRNSLTLHLQTVTNLILLAVSNSDKDFFNILYQNNFNESSDIYFISGLYNFKEINKLNELVKNNRNLSSHKKNEIKSFIATDELNDNDFLKFIKASNVTEDNTFQGLIFIAYKLYEISNNDFYELNKKIISIDINDLGFKRVLVDYFFDTKQFYQATLLIEGILNNNDEELFVIYLESLIETLQYSKAKLLIEKYMNSIDDRLASFTNQVNKLVYISQDIKLIEPLIPKLERFDNTSWYWRLKIQVSLIKENYGQLKKDFREMPIELDNDAKNITWIVYQEILHSNSQKVLSRIISLWRSNPSDKTILVSIQNLFTSTLTLDKLKAINPFFDNAPTEVIDGCFIEFEVDNCIDQVFIDSLAHDQNSNIVAHPNDSIGKAFMHKKVGDTVEIDIKFGGKSSIIIRDILSISQGIFRNNLKSANGIQNPFNMISLEVDIDSEDSMENFLKQLEQITSSKQSLEEKLELYQKNPMTVSTLANYIGKDISEIAYNWINDFRFPLRTIDNDYTNDISLHELNVLLEKNPSVVVDLFTLIELQRTKNLDLICNSISIIIPQTALSILKESKTRLDNNIQGIDIPLSIDDKSDGIDTNNSNIDSLNNRKVDTQVLIDCIENNFKVFPAYGNNSHSDIVKAISETYPESDKSIIRLCQEKHIPLLSLDARLRAIAHQADVLAINFYDYLTLSEKDCTKKTIKNFHVEQFVQNRDSIGFNLEDLLNYALKDRHSLNLSINSLLKFMSIYYEFNEALTQLLHLTQGLHFKEIKTTDKFIEDLCNLMLFFLNKSNKLDFYNHKRIINFWFNYYFQLTPIKASNFQTVTTINTNKFYIKKDDSITFICSED